MSVSWAVVSDRPGFSGHYEALSSALKKCGAENSFSFVSATSENLGEQISELRAKGVTSIRLEGTLPYAVLNLFPNIPSNIRLLNSADTIFFDAQGREWLRNYLYDGFSRFTAHELKTLDLTGAAFVIGTGSQADAIIASLARTGFNRILIVGQSDEGGPQFVESLKKSFFNVNFQFTPRSQVMHLAGVHSIAINTLCANDDQAQLAELFYFNFLKAGAIWVEVPCEKPNSSLIQEAKNAGAIVHEGLDLLVHVDSVWAESCFNCTLNASEYRADLESRIAKPA